MIFFFFKQKTAYEIYQCDWSSDVCSSDLMQAKELEQREKEIVRFCMTPKTREEIQEFIGIKNRDYFRKEILKPLIERGFLLQTIPDKPNSPKQKYYSALIEKPENET